METIVIPGKLSSVPNLIVVFVFVRYTHHRGYAVVCLGPVIEAVGVSLQAFPCNSDRLNHRTKTNYCITPVTLIDIVKNSPLAYVHVAYVESLRVII